MLIHRGFLKMIMLIIGNFCRAFIVGWLNAVHRSATNTAIIYIMYRRKLDLNSLGSGHVAS